MDLFAYIENIWKYHFLGVSLVIDTILVFFITFFLQQLFCLPRLLYPLGTPWIRCIKKEMRLLMFSAINIHQSSVAILRLINVR